MFGIASRVLSKGFVLIWFGVVFSIGCFYALFFAAGAMEENRNCEECCLIGDLQGFEDPNEIHAFPDRIRPVRNRILRNPELMECAVDYFDGSGADDQIRLVFFADILIEFTEGSPELKRNLVRIFLQGTEVQDEFVRRSSVVRLGWTVRFAKVRDESTKKRLLELSLDEDIVTRKHALSALLFFEDEEIDKMVAERLNEMKDEEVLIKKMIAFIKANFPRHREEGVKEDRLERFARFYDLLDPDIKERF